LATVLATFQKIGQFFSNHLVTLIRSLSQSAFPKRRAPNKGRDIQNDIKSKISL
jgi:hypothetical protein